MTLIVLLSSTYIPYHSVLPFFLALQDTNGAIADPINLLIIFYSNR